MILFLYLSIFRSRGFRYFCSCVANCWKKDQPTCEVNKQTRNNCKYCRYEKCINLAGMQSQWVISAHIPKVERKPSKQNVAQKAKNVATNMSPEDNDLLRNVESIYQLNVEPGSELLQVPSETIFSKCLRAKIKK